MKRRNLILLMIIIAMLFSGCSFYGEDLNSMLTPPAMSMGREALSQAIKAAIGENYELVYPQAGSYRTGIISEDLTGDGVNEAICFYRPSGKEDHLCFLVMKESGENWSAMSKGESEAESVGRVAFGDLNGDGIAEIVVGWQYLGETEGSFDVYTITAKAAESQYSGLYSRFAMMAGDVCRLAVISRNSATKAVTASLIGEDRGKVGLINSVAMQSRVADYLNVVAGTVVGGLPAVYVDSVLESGQCVTEVLTVNEQGRLTNELLTQMNVTSWRKTAVSCRDVNGDGVLEIPVEESLPSYVRDGLTENLYLIRWNSFDGKLLTPVSYSFVEMTENITVHFPDEWHCKVTVERSAAAERSFVFKTYDGDPLFTLRIFDQEEYGNEQSMEGWHKLHTDSDYVYAVLCEEKNELNIDHIRVANLFEVG